MFKTALIAAAIASTALLEWRAEPDLQAIDYVARPDATGELNVGGWRLDGGYYVSDSLHSLAFITTADRMGLMTNAFRYREDDGVPAWTTKAAMSVSADRNGAYVEINCGLGPEFTGNDVQATAFIAAIVPQNAPSVGNGGLVGGVLAAASIDLASGAIEPISPTGVTCLMEDLP